MGKSSKESISSNLIWRLMERFGAQGVTFVVSIILARLLDPDVYGTVALVTVFTSIMQVFVDSGLGNALIQKMEADDIDFSSVFYFNIVFCILLYIFMFFLAPIISNFYNRGDLVPILRVLSLTIIISGLKNVQQAYVSRNMMFKKFFFSTLGGTLGAAIIGIWMAYAGFGVWALVAQNLLNVLIDTIVLWFTVKWRPVKKFSFGRLKSLFSYGWKLLTAQLVDTIYEDFRSLIIGKYYSSSDLAYYNRGKQLPQLAVTNINTAIDSVLFPSMSMEQNNLERVKAMTSRAVKTTSYVITPIMIGLAVCAEPLVIILLTDKWLPSVTYMRIFCFGMALTPILLANLNAIKAIGRSDIYLKLEIVRKCVGFVTLFSMMWFGVKAIAYSYLLNCVINVIVNSMPNKKLLNYGFFEQAKDIIPSYLLSILMGALVYCVTFLNLDAVPTLSIQILLGVAIYISTSAVLKIDSFRYIYSSTFQKFNWLRKAF